MSGLPDLAAVRAYCLAGNATFTLANPQTGSRRTYKLVRARPRVGQLPADAPLICSVLTGPDNGSDYEYLGQVWDSTRLTYCHSSKSTISHASPAARGIGWLIRHLDRGTLPLDKMEIHHEGTCGRCGRALTVPESIERGLGPECARKAGAA